MLHKVYNLNENFKNYFSKYDFHNLYKELLNFCTTDLSAFYFDIRKDSLYCDSKDSEKRKSCIIVLNVILESLIKWFAPILSFTTEEIFTLINKDQESIHLQRFIKIPNKYSNEQIKKKMARVKKN
jgi:isoleucyl-tRNA synthetase